MISVDVGEFNVNEQQNLTATTQHMLVNCTNTQVCRPWFSICPTHKHTPGLWSCYLSLWCRWWRSFLSLLLVAGTNPAVDTHRKHTHTTADTMITEHVPAVSKLTQHCKHCVYSYRQLLPVTKITCNKHRCDAHALTSPLSAWDLLPCGWNSLLVVFSSITHFWSQADSESLQIKQDRKSGYSSERHKGVLWGSVTSVSQEIQIN